MAARTNSRDAYKSYSEAVTKANQRVALRSAFTLVTNYKWPHDAWEMLPTVDSVVLVRTVAPWYTCRLEARGACSIQ